VRGGKHEGGVAPERRLSHGGILAGTVGAEGVEGAGDERHGPFARPRLRVPHGEGADIEIDVFPPERQDFALA
jgi:hypothetical protein